MSNYAALGECTAYGQQAKDAAMRRYAELHNLGTALLRLAQQPAAEPTPTELLAQLDRAMAADREMRAALQRANQAAALCGQVELHARALLPQRD